MIVFSLQFIQALGELTLRADQNPKAHERPCHLDARPHRHAASVAIREMEAPLVERLKLGVAPRC